MQNSGKESAPALAKQRSDLIESLHEQTKRNQELNANLEVVKRAFETNTDKFKRWRDEQGVQVLALRQGATKSDEEFEAWKARRDTVLQTYRGIDNMQEVVALLDELMEVEERQEKAVRLKIEAAVNKLQLAQDIPMIMSQCDRLARMAEVALQDGVCFDCAVKRQESNSEVDME
jgi:hypothetical protein